jgi:FkbM family methyltransferase
MTDESQQPPRGSFVHSMLLLQHHGIGGSTFLDIGAAEGLFFLHRRGLDLFPGARHFFVDAMQENEPHYRRLGERFGTGHEIAALSSMEGEVSLRIDPTFYNTHIDHVQADTRYPTVRRVPLTTLDRVVERHALQPPFILKLDVQGAELDVLRGAPRTLEQATVVTVEIQIFNARETLLDFLMFMQARGWVLYDLTDPAHYPSDQSLYQVYATFIPARLDFRRDSVWCLPDQEPQALEELRRRRAFVLEAIDELIRNA